MPRAAKRRRESGDVAAAQRNSSDSDESAQWRLYARGAHRARWVALGTTAPNTTMAAFQGEEDNPAARAAALAAVQQCQTALAAAAAALGRAGALALSRDALDEDARRLAQPPLPPSTTPNASWRTSRLALTLDGLERRTFAPAAVVLGPDQLAASGAPIERLLTPREQLMAFYQHHAPDKLQDPEFVPRVLAKFDPDNGSWGDLEASLQERYPEGPALSDFAILISGKSDGDPWAPSQCLLQVGDEFKTPQITPPPPHDMPVRLLPGQDASRSILAMLAHDEWIWLVAPSVEEAALLAQALCPTRLLDGQPPRCIRCFARCSDARGTCLSHADLAAIFATPAMSDDAPPTAADLLQHASSCTCCACCAAHTSEHGICKVCGNAPSESGVCCRRCTGANNSTLASLSRQQESHDFECSIRIRLACCDAEANGLHWSAFDDDAAILAAITNAAPEGCISQQGHIYICEAAAGCSGFISGARPLQCPRCHRLACASCVADEECSLCEAQASN
eukprot:m.79129 g.79129  ORF g.79129 m.79129 type:complete len:510 (-) comp8175_c0_seq1:13-1542(-)